VAVAVLPLLETPMAVAVAVQAALELQQILQ
jgi:hypothetical protein